jgi:CheY-like chemotaxis protein
MKGFADNLKNIRKSLRFSQEELARRMRIAQSTVGMWESGKRTPKLADMKKLAHVLNVTIERLLGEPERKIEIIKDLIYVDGKKVRELDRMDVDHILEYIESLKMKKPARATSGPEPPQRGAKKVLVIEDEQQMCELLYNFLVPHNYKVFVTFNGQMGLEYFQEIKPDVVLLDLTLPDIDGSDVLKIIRKVSDVPVLIITAHPENIVDIHLDDLQIEGYISKPFALQEILNTLKHIVGD